MRVLALDTTTRAGSVAIVEDGRVLVERAGDPSRTHAERLPADVIEAVSSIGMELSAIDLFAVASGPGSFTGLRIGIATVQGFAFVLEKRVAPVSALTALAQAAATGRAAGTRAGAWMDAHRRDVFSALFEVGDEMAMGLKALIEVEPPMVGAPAETLERWALLGTPEVICGDGASLYAGLLPASVAAVGAPPLAGLIGRLAIAAAAENATVSPAGVQPLYVRRPDAEVARDALLGRR
jgi:tRNA threonylcarbamoyladenosine biosynthesis protein TsaB